MKISRLILKNIKCYKFLDLSFEQEDESLRKRTVILGNNGTGKSTVLKSIALILAGSSALGELLGSVDDWIRHKQDSGSIEIHLKTSRNEARFIKLEFQRGDTLTRIIERNKESLSLLDEAIEHTERNYLTIGYGVHRRVGGLRFNSKSSNFNSRRAENVATLFDSDASLYPFESWVMDLDYQKGEGALKQIKSALNKLLPQAKFYKIDKENKSLLFKNKDGIVNFRQLSDGFQITANWIGDLLYRITKTYKDYKNPFKARFILMIDEIALHLHPAWQRVIIQSITELFTEVQLIASTHSPFVAQQAGEGELFTIIRNNKNELDLFHYENDPRKLLIHQIIMSDIFGLATDESVAVEKAKNEIRLDPERKLDASIKFDVQKIKNLKSQNLTDLKGVDNISDIPVNLYSYEKNITDYDELIDKLEKEVKKIRDDKAK